MKAEYIDHLGSDLTVVNAARVSMDKHHDVFGEGDTKLLKYLATHNHWTPFSHPQITMRETVPIFVARQRFKHMVGFTYNEVSRRYVDDTPDFYTPEVWRSRPEGSIKQGSGEQEVVDMPNPWTDNCYEVDVKDFYQQHLEACSMVYDSMLKAGVAPEQARMVLPQSMYTSYYVTGSLSAWARAYKQRIDPHAQVEIQDLAKQWGSIISPLYPESWEALTR